MAGPSKVRVVLADRDRDLLARLTVELSVAGMEVETLDSTFGLTPELLALSFPDVIVLDVGLPGLPEAAIPAIFSDLRKRRRVRCMVVVEGDRPEVARAAARLGADSGVPRAGLLDAGARALKEQSTPPAPPEPAQAEDPLGHVPQGRPNALRKPRGPALPTVDLHALIEEELAKAPPEAPRSGPPRLEASLDLFSEHQVYVGREGTLASGGIFVATAVQPAVGEEVLLELTIFRRVKAQLQGKVAWATGTRVSGKQSGGVGVAVAAMPDEVVRALNRLMEERRPITWIPR